MVSSGQEWDRILLLLLLGILSLYFSCRFYDLQLQTRMASSLFLCVF